jgi:pimeloyl-ACP methyl ester carboxylesterase
MRSAPANRRGPRVVFERHGESGPPLLLLHSIGLDRHSWDDVVPGLAPHFRVAAADLPGHGESDKPADEDYGLWALGRRLVGLLDELGWERAAVAGNSLGGGVGLSMALQAPERVTALALVNSVGFPDGLPLVGRLGFLPLVPAATGLAPPPVIRVGLASARRRWTSVSTARSRRTRAYLRDPEGRAAFFRALRQLYGPDLGEMAARYGEIRCPALVLHGANDPLVRLPYARRLAERLPGGRLEVLPGCGHFPPEECPAAVADALRRFLSDA